MNGDLPDRFPGHERRLYLFGCRNKACRRKDSSVRGFRWTRAIKDAAAPTIPEPQQVEKDRASSPPPSITQPRTDLGQTLFGATSSSPSSTVGNPFSTSTSSGALPSASNPFATSSLAAKPAQKPTDTDGLVQTFAEKARISTANTAPPSAAAGAAPSHKEAEPWPDTSSFPEPFPRYHIDADKEYLEPEPQPTPQQTRVADVDTEAGGSGSGSAADDKVAFESSMDRTFQRFADRLAQNPEQILRYDFAGQPLLYSKRDAVGRAWPGVPRCGGCGAQRTFELQLAPHAITELEAEEISLEGMDWGTIVFAACGGDCEGWVEEWVGVQWEELASKSKP